MDESLSRDKSWRALAQDVTLGAALAVAVVAWFGWRHELLQPAPDERLVALAWAGGAICLLAGALPRLHESARNPALVALTFAGAWLGYGAWGYAAIAPFFMVPVIVASFGPTPWLAAVAEAAALVVLARTPTAENATVSAACFLLLLCGTSVQVAARLARRDLADAWAMADRATRLTRELQARQQEVNQLNKALQLSNHLLKRSNHEHLLLRREAEEARRAKERFAAAVSHELRTPLNIILGFTEILQRFPESYGMAVWPVRLRQDIAEVQRSARYLSELIDDILDLARVEALRMPLRRTWVTIADLLDDTTALARRLLVGRAVRLVVEDATKVPEVYVDVTRIRQVLLNLLANAARFTDSGTITVGARLEGENVVVWVRDTGRGMPADQLEHVFEEFRQADGADPEIAGKGKGLGLTIARRFVQLHGGRIWATSAVGVGSTFQFSLPLAAKTVSYSRSPGLAVESRQGDTTLVVLDEDGGAAAYLDRWLEGCRVVHARGLDEAEHLVARERPVALVLNVPGHVRFEVYAATVMARLGERVPVIRCSLPFGAWLVDGEAFDCWLTKPVAFGRLTEALESLGDWRRVLIVDDDRSFSQLMLRMLDLIRPGCLVAWAYTAADALARLAEEAWDVLLIDISLPDMDGRQLARRAREVTCQGTHIVAVSALQPTELERQPVATSVSLTRSQGLTESEVLRLLAALLTALPLSAAGTDATPQAAASATPA